MNEFPHVPVGAALSRREPPDWRTATCGACEFRMPRAAHSCCRRFPANERPRILDEAPEYPLVFDDTPACAEFRQRSSE